VKPTAEGGALRAQSPRRTAGEPRVLNGSILRVDPATGAAAPGNPLFGSSDPNEQRIIGYGFRNPFRMIVKPGTNDVWIADVGWSAWEEIDRIPDLTSARNFGWPCFEGPGTRYTGLNICPTQDQTTGAVFQYNHSSVAVPGDGCPAGGSAIAGMAFYLGGSNYPATYDGAFFLSDFTRNCVWVMFAGAGGDPDPATIAPFASSAQGPVDMQVGPDGNVYYVDFDGGRIIRIVFGLHAAASANPTSGPLPLTVQFDSTGTVPAAPGDVLAYAWDLDGDGQYDDSTSPSPSFIYNTIGTYTVRLRVTDNHGGFDISAPVTINAGSDAPTATILTPSSSLTWKVGDLISFSGEATDPQDGDLPPSALSWSILIQHCPSGCHTHLYQTFSGVASGSFIAPDHEYPSYLEIQLTATDSSNLTSTTSVNINPQTAALTFHSVPSGLLLSSGTLTQPAPFTQTVIVNSQNTIIAPQQGAYPTIWEFVSWSDGGAQSHTITATPSPVTFTANFAAYADLSIAMSDTPDPVCQGQPLTYTLNVANGGPSRATTVTVIDTLPSGATLISATGNGWNCTGAAAVTCTRPALDLG
ncbi:MAG: PQQ-dependent sugar dehydrogenase, partial [Thermoanaerobaculia bacterium]